MQIGSWKRKKLPFIGNVTTNALSTLSNVWKNFDVDASGEPRASHSSRIAKALTPNALAHVHSNVGNQMRCCSNELLENVTHEPDRFLSLMWVCVCVRVSCRRYDRNIENIEKSDTNKSHSRDMLVHVYHMHAMNRARANHFLKTFKLRGNGYVSRIMYDSFS